MLIYKKIILKVIFLQKETIPKLIAEGAPREKLILGIPAYGRSFQLANKNNNGIGAAVTGPGEPGYFTKEQGFLAYHEVSF